MSKIFVIGDWMLDKTTHVTTRGVSPESENSLVCVVSAPPTYSLGGAANVAANVKGLGGDVVTMGAVGNDAAALRITQLFASNNIQYCAVRFSGSTTVKDRIRTYSGQLLRIDTEDVETVVENVLWTDSAERARLHKELNSRSVVCLVDYDKGFCTQSVISDVARLCYKVNATLLIDPGRSGNWVAHWVCAPAILKVNISQALMFCARSLEPFRLKLQPNKLYSVSEYSELLSHVRDVALRQGISFSWLWITFGAGGMGCITCEGKQFMMTHQKQPHVVDVCGAGDTAMAAMAVHLARSAGRTEADFNVGLRLANNAARKAVQHIGAYVACDDDLNDDQCED